MGTWGVHSFDNDDAVEWAGSYRSMGLSLAGSTIQVAREDIADGNLTADIATRAIAAAEAVALALGRGSDEAKRLLDGAPEADPEKARALVPACDDLVAAIGSASELGGLWKRAGGGQHDQWIAALDDLRARLSGKARAAAPAPASVSAPVAAGSDEPAEDLHGLVAALSGEVAALRREMAEGFEKLARRMEDRRG